VWCADPDDLHAPASIARARNLLNGGELERLERYRFERDRRQFLARRVLVRTVLSKYESVAPAAWQFASNAHGRPSVLGVGQWLHFSLSNTRGLVVCAVANRLEVGVDVECLDRAAPLEIADWCLAPPEIEALLALPPPERATRFFDYWTLKESYVKARGIGLSQPLDRLAFVLERGRNPRITIDGTLGDDSSCRHFRQFLPTPTHLVSVCVQRLDQHTPLVVLRWQRFLNETGDGSTVARNAVITTANDTGIQRDP
jgi:4'-phosphopantetheinyl transferase